MVQVIIGIAGASGSGKTTISKSIYSALKEDAILINHDAYYKSYPNLSLEERALINFDHPDSLDTELMIHHIQELKRGNVVQMPQYDFTTHQRSNETVHLNPTTVVLVEGILLYTEPALRELLDIKIFVDTDADICLLRRIERDVEQRGRTLSSVLTQYQETVKPMYHKFVEPSRRYSDIIIPQGGYNDVANSIIINRAKSIIRKHQA